jgi:hypothetical protein
MLPFLWSAPSLETLQACLNAEETDMVFVDYEEISEQEFEAAGDPHFMARARIIGEPFNTIVENMASKNQQLLNQR